MKLNKVIILAVLPMLLIGCGGSEMDEAEKKANKTFMFWCFRKEIVSEEYHVPEMKTPEAAAYLRNRLKNTIGYTDSTADLQKNTLTISYESSVTRKMNFEETIALAGFKVNNRPANPKVKLPQGLK